MRFNTKTSVCVCVCVVRGNGGKLIFFRCKIAKPKKKTRRLIHCCGIQNKHYSSLSSSQSSSSPLPPLCPEYMQCTRLRWFPLGIQEWSVRVSTGHPKGDGIYITSTICKALCTKLAVGSESVSISAYRCIPSHPESNWARVRTPLETGGSIGMYFLHTHKPHLTLHLCPFLVWKWNKTKQKRKGHFFAFVFAPHAVLDPKVYFFVTSTQLFAIGLNRRVPHTRLYIWLVDFLSVCGCFPLLFLSSTTSARSLSFSAANETNCCLRWPRALHKPSALVVHHEMKSSEERKLKASRWGWEKKQNTLQSFRAENWTVQRAGKRLHAGKDSGGRRERFYLFMIEPS